MAFIVFTSGSTGLPKGVVHRHASVCTSLEAFVSAVGYDENSRVIQFASLAFIPGKGTPFAGLSRRAN